MKLEAARKIFAHLNAAAAVAALVEQRRKSPNAELSRKHRDDAAADPALRRQPDAIAPLARVIVHAAAVHDAQDVLHVPLFDRAAAGERPDHVNHHRARDAAIVGTLVVPLNEEALTV